MENETSPARLTRLVGLSAILSVDDSEVYIARLRDSIIRNAGNKWMAIKYHNGTVGDFSAVEFRCDDRVCDLIVCTRTDFNHCEILHVHMQPNAKADPAAVVGGSGSSALLGHSRFYGHCRDCRHLNTCTLSPLPEGGCVNWEKPC